MDVLKLPTLLHLRWRNGETDKGVPLLRDSSTHRRYHRKEQLKSQRIYTTVRESYHYRLHRR